ncbi:MAG TPA: nodulation protein NfeD [Luteimonas sp.]|nr:nodulation protein NfeD [Luteimonas sp.]
MKLGRWVFLPAWGLVAFGLLLLSPAHTAAPATDATADVVLLEIQGGIGPASHDYLRRGLARAAADGAPAVVLRIDTPGGLDAATRDINRAILASPVPVIAWVGPSGARAASAGTYIVYASHLAAMAPATSLGAATPVPLGGAPNREAEPEPEPKIDGERSRDAPDAKPSRGRDDGAMSRKAVNDAVAYLRSLAELRGRNVDFAEAAVRDAATLTASAALDQGVIEILATDIDDLLRQADGREVQLGDRRQALSTAERTVTPLAPDWRNRILSVIAEPAVAYLLLLVGLYGLMFEGYSPGAIVPGVVGGICLLLALYALQVLPVNYVGVALIVLGVALMLAEIASPSFGALGIGGMVALVVGSVVLFDTEDPGFGVPGGLIAGIAVASGLVFMTTLWLAARSRTRPVVTGVDELLSEPATALDDFHGRGRVAIRGETWQADSATPVRRGQRLRVLQVDGLVLRVAPAAAEASTRPEGDKP